MSRIWSILRYIQRALGKSEYSAVECHVLWMSTGFHCWWCCREFFYIVGDFLSSRSVSCWEKCIVNCGFVCFSFPSVFAACVIFFILFSSICLYIWSEVFCFLVFLSLFTYFGDSVSRGRAERERESGACQTQGSNPQTVMVAAVGMTSRAHNTVYRRPHFAIWVKGRNFTLFTSLYPLSLLPGGGGIVGSQCVCIDVWEGGGRRGGLVTGQQTWKSWLPWPYDIPHWWECLGTLTHEVGRSHQIPTWPSLMWIRPLFFPWCLAGVELLLSRNVLPCWLVPFLIPWLDKVGFCWGCVVFSVPIGFFWVAKKASSSFFGSKSGINEAKRKHRELTTMSFLGSWDS